MIVQGHAGGEACSAVGGGFGVVVEDGLAHVVLVLGFLG